MIWRAMERPRPVPFGFVVTTFVWSGYFVARVHTPSGAVAEPESEEEEDSGGFVAGFRTIAAGYDPKLSYALKKVADVEIYTYEVDFKLKAFSPDLSRRS